MDILIYTKLMNTHHLISPEEKKIRFNMPISIAYFGAVVRSALERWP